MDSRAIINVIDNLESTSATDALSANQGRVLKDLFDGLESSIENHLTGSFNLNDFNTFGVHWFKGSTTLTNQPSGVVNGWLIVLNSELTVKQIWLRSGTPNSTDHEIYTRTYASSDGWSDWYALHNVDSGWIDIPLASGITAYSSNTIPQYRKRNGVVYLRGAVKGITARGTTIGTLPSGYRPVNYEHNYTQLTTTQEYSANFTRLKIATTGEIVMSDISSGINATYDSGNWYPIHTSYLAE